MFNKLQKIKKLVFIIIFFFVFQVLSPGISTAAQYGALKFDKLNSSENIQEKPEQVIVKFKNNLPDAARNSMLHDIGGEVVRQLSDGQFLIETSNNIHSILDYLQKNPNIESAEYNYKLNAQGHASDPMYDDQWALKYVEVYNAWDAVSVVLDGSSPETVVVAVLDMGVDGGHEDLAGRVLPGQNFITDVPDPTDTSDSIGHGTAVAGIIAATTNNDLGIAGAAGEFPVKILPIKVLQNDLTGTVADISDGIRWAVDWRGDNNERVKLINLSFGERLSEIPQTLDDAVQYAFQNGVIVIAAAGNDGGSITGFYPADLDGVVSVGASGQDQLPYDFSNTDADIMAPGVDILTTVTDSVYGYENRTGTSFSAPFAAAAAALLWTAYPGETAEKITSALLTAEKEYELWMGGSNYETHRVLNADKAIKLMIPPEPPKNLAYLANDSNVQLTWDEPGGWVFSESYEYDLIAFRVYRNGELIAELTQTESTYQGDRVLTGFADSGLNPLTAYYYDVTAIDAVGNESNPSSITAETESGTSITTSRVSISTSGEEGNGYSDDAPVISADDRYVAFASDASNLVENDTNNSCDIFVHDRDNRTTERVSIASDGTEGNSVSYDFDMSADGRYVVFYSNATNLTTEGNKGIHVHDRNTGITVWINSGDGPSISSDGRYIVYKTSYPYTRYIWDRDSDENGIFDEVDGTSTTSLGSIASYAISADGRYVVYQYNNGIWIFDIVAGNTVRVDVTTAGEVADASSSYPSISGDGRYVTFLSDAGNLVEGYAENDSHIYVHDRDADGDGIYDETSQSGGVINEMVDVSSAGTPGNDVPEAGTISDNGRYVAFKSYADNLAYGDTNGDIDVFLRDLISGKTVRMNVSSGGLQSNSNWTGDVVSVSNTGAVAYQSYATNLVDGDTNGEDDIFVSEIGYGAPVWPTGAALTATNIGQTFVGLEWTPAQHGVGIASYRLVESEQVIAIVDGNITSNMVQNLQPETEYAFRVDASDSVGNWVYGPTTSCTTSALSGTANLVVDVESGSTANLQWDAVFSDSEAVAYAIWRSDSGGAAEQVAQVPLGTTSFQDIGLAAGTEYSYVIKIITGNQSQFNHSEQVTVNTPLIYIDGIEWRVPRTINGLAKLDENLTVVLAGEPNRQGWTEVTCQTYDQDGNLQNTVYNVSLAESTEQPGRYMGTFAVEEGIAEITSIKGIISDGGSEATREAGNLPIEVSGAILVNIICDSPEILENAKLSVWSHMASSGDQTQITSTEIYELKDLVPSAAYRLEVTGADDAFRVTEEGVSVSAGRKENVDLTVPSPSIFQVKVVDENSDPVSDVRLAFYDSSDSFMGYFSTDVAGLTPWQLIYTSRVMARAKVGNIPYYNREYNINLDPGLSEETLILEPLPTGVIKGYTTTTDGQPIGEINVSVSQIIDGRIFSYNATSDETGYYETTLLAGNANVYVGDKVGRYQPVDKSEIDITIHDGGEEQLDLIFTDLGYGEIDISLYTKYLDGEWMGSLDIDSETLAHLGMSYSGGLLVSHVNPLLVKNVKPGSEITISFNGREAGLAPQSQTVVFDDDLKANTEFRLAEKGRVVADLLDALTGEPPAALWQGEILHGTYTLFEVDTEGQRKYIINSRSFHYLAGSSVYDKLEVSVPSAGTYDLDIVLNVGTAELGKYDVLYGSTRVDVAENQILEISSPIMLAKKGFFAGAENYLHALPGEVVPGGLINLRVGYKNTGRHPQGNSIWALDDSQILLDLPAGTTLMENSVMLNGQQVENYNVTTDGVVEIPVGYLDVGQTGTLDCKLQVSSTIDPTITSLSIKARMNFSYGLVNNVGSTESQETIDYAAVRIPGITIVAPTKLNNLDTTISGRAPVGSIVSIFDRNFLVGSVETSPGGFWSLDVNLPYFGNPVWHLLRAETQYGERELQSEELLVRFDSTKPQITRFTMQQNDSRTVSFNTGDGIARFPYVFGSRQPLIFKVELDQPERVYNAKLRIGENASIVLNRQNDGSFIGSTALSSTNLPGPIYVSYEAMPAEDAFRQPAPSEEELRLRLPLWASDFEVLPKVNTMTAQAGPDPFHGPVSSTERFNLPQLNDTEVEYTRTIEAGMNYTPSYDALQFVQETGIPVYDFNFSHRPTPSGTEITMSGYIPLDKIQLDNNLVAIADTDQVLRGAAITWTHVKDVAELGMDLYDYKGLAEWPWDAMDARDKLDALLEMSEDCSSGGNFYRDWIEGISTDMLIGDVSNGLLGIAGVIFVPVTFGGSLASFGVSLAMSEAMDAKINRSIESVKDAILSDADCDNNKDSNRNRNNEDNDNIVADPTWIWDPSGYVYEVVPENRIENVTATALYQDKDTGEWVFWDAEWYGQENPLQTDLEGKYGWDVPMGLWKVAYQKEGYEMTYSEDTYGPIEVLPIHTEVNIPMESLSAPVVQTITPATSREYIEIAFDKHMLVSILNTDTIAVSNSEDQELTGSIEYIDTVEYKGREVAQKVRFISDELFVPGESYTVFVNQLVQSYNDRMMTENVLSTITIPAVGEVADAVVTSDDGTASINWTDPDSEMLSEIRIYTRMKGFGEAFGQAVTINPGVQSHTYDGLFNGVEYEIKLTAVDTAGNETAGVLVVASPEAPEMPGQISNVKATTGSGEIRLTWNEPPDYELYRIGILWKGGGCTVCSSGLGGYHKVDKGVGQYTISGLKEGITYEISLISLMTSGSKAQPVIVTVELGSNDGEPADEAIALDREALTWDSIKGTNNAINSVTANLINPLPTAGANGTIITWSADPSGWVNTSAGAVTRPTSAQGDKTVTLTATISKDGGTDQTKTFDLTIKAKASTGSGGGGSSVTPTPEPAVNATVEAGTYRENFLATVDSAKGSITVNLNTDTLNVAFEEAEAGSDGVKTVSVEIPTVQGTNSYTLKLPAAGLASKSADRMIKMASEAGTITLPGNMLEGFEIENTGNVGISIGKADRSKLPQDVQDSIGEKPIVELRLTSGNKTIEWTNPAAPVTVSIPYTPTVEELADSEHIVVWYIDGEGNVVSIPNGRYNTETGAVTFTTTHFSYYALAYVHKIFGDLNRVEWARKSIEVLASKGVLKGIAEKEYAPQTNITRADFLYFLIRTLGIDARVDGNFADIKKGPYYYKEIAIAKKLGITTGTGNNRFSPDASITRQDMMVLTERALTMLNKLEQQDTALDLEIFSDKSLIAAYAVDSVASLVKEGLIVGSEDRINPLGNTTRAEAAVLLYRIYNKF